MANPLVTVATVLGVAAAAWAGPCEEGRGQTGVALVPGEDGFRVAAVDPGSAGAERGVRKNDVVVQVNGTVVHSCADYGRAVRDARKAGIALLALVRRGGVEVALALPAATWDRTVATPAPPPVEPPTVRPLVASPPALPPEQKVTVEEVTKGLAALAPAGDEPTDVESYRRDLLRVHRQVETLAVRKAVGADVVDGLRTVLRYFDAADVAWDAEERLRERERRPRRLPFPEGAPAPYFADSEEAAVIDEFPFLEASVVRPPQAGFIAGERSGSWRPIAARRLLWERGREETARLATWLEG